MIRLLAFIAFVFSLFLVSSAAGERILWCDLNGDQACDCQDIDRITEAVGSGDTASIFDINGDGTVDVDDRHEFIFERLGSTYGDTNLDGVFDSSDLVESFAAGNYENPASGNDLSYCDGDWNGDGEFDSSDLVLALRHQGEFVGALPPPTTISGTLGASPVPEPSSQFLLLSVGIVLGVRRGHSNRN